jgi:hypothetical protein
MIGKCLFLPVLVRENPKTGGMMALGLTCDRMPPVDAIYRPHVVHHIHPPEMMAQQVKGKQKRYFSADD